VSSPTVELGVTRAARTAAQGLRAFYSQPVGWLALGTELPGSRETDRGGVGFPTPCVQPMVGPLALSFSGQYVPNGISERCFLLINS